MASLEKEFTLFALSYPQCQTDFHVSRFLKEAFPGIEKSADEEIVAGEAGKVFQELRLCS